MIDNLQNLVRQNAGDAVINNPAIPNEKNDVAVSEAGNSIFSTLKNALGQGKIREVLNYFKGGSSAGSGEVVQEATTHYAQQLQNNLGVNAQEANSVANKVVPQTMSQLAAKTADPNDKSFNIQDIFNQLSGGKTSGFNVQSLLNKYTGGKLDKDGDGDVDFQDLKAMFTGSGGVVEKVKGFLKSDNLMNRRRCNADYCTFS